MLSLIKFDLPFGGGVTVVSMLPIVVCSHRWGWKWGVVTAFVYSVLQLILGLDNVGYATSFVMALGVVFLDYIIAYTFIGLSGVFDVFMGKTRWSGMTMTSPWFYSFLYNGWYMLAELVLTEIVAMLIYIPLGRYFRREDIVQ